jgi:hypothetical protein
MAGLDYEFAPIDVSIMTHPKACAAGPEAMGLWLWGQTYSKLHKTGGRIHRSAALVAWGGKRNIMLAKRLVTAGLWLALEDGDWDVHNFEAKSPGRRTQTGDAPLSGTERVRKHRAEKKAREESGRASDVTQLDVTVTPVTRSSNACNSTSTSSESGSGSLGDARGGHPEWFEAAAATASLAGSPVTDLPARWVQFLGSCERRVLSPTQGLAASWLVSTMRAERREDARKSAARPSEITKQSFDPDAPWIKLGDTGS